MACKRHSAEEIVNKLHKAEALITGGTTIAQVRKQIGATDQTYIKWWSEYGGLKTSQAKRFKELEQENARSKRMLAEAHLDKAMLQGITRGNVGVRTRRAERSTRCVSASAYPRGGHAEFFGINAQYSGTRRRA